MAEIRLHVDGMHCGSCIRRVTQAIQSAAASGAGPFTVSEVRLGAARFTAPDAPGVEAPVIASLAKAGFTARVEA